MTELFNVKEKEPSTPHTFQVMCFLGNSVLAEWQLKTLVHPYELREPRTMRRSRAYFCPDCGEVWARILYLGSPFNYPLLRRCEKHWTTFEPEAGQLTEFANLNDPLYPLAVYQHDAMVMALRETALDELDESCDNYSQ